MGVKSQLRDRVGGHARTLWGTIEQRTFPHSTHSRCLTPGVYSRAQTQTRLECIMQTNAPPCCLLTSADMCHASSDVMHHHLDREHGHSRDASGGAGRYGAVVRGLVSSRVDVGPVVDASKRGDGCTLAVRLAVAICGVVCSSIARAAPRPPPPPPPPPRCTPPSNHIPTARVFATRLYPPPIHRCRCRCRPSPDVSTTWNPWGARGVSEDDRRSKARDDEQGRNSKMGDMGEVNKRMYFSHPRLSSSKHLRDMKI